VLLRYRQERQPPALLPAGRCRRRNVLLPLDPSRRHSVPRLQQQQ